MTILADHNIEGQAQILLGILSADGWVGLCSLKLTTFAEIGLRIKANDREVWRFAQENGMLLLTENRNMKGNNSLEQTIREENTETSLPVVTIGNVQRLVQKSYRVQCASRLIEIIVDLDKNLGIGRIYIP